MAEEEEEEYNPTKLCFVVSPIGAPGSPERRHADWLLRGIIEPVFENGFDDYRVERADKINAPGMIDSQVITRLLDAELVIADMSLLNANAFYEMGIRHMKQKPIIHMYREGEKIPFDVAPHRAIAFSYEHPDELTIARVALRAALDEVLKPDFQVENPVTRARGFQQIEQHATPEQKLLIGQMQDMQSRMDQLERSIRVANDTAIRAIDPSQMEYRYSTAGRVMSRKWEFSVDVTPTDENRVDQIATNILKLGRNLEIVRDGSDLLTVTSDGPATRVRRVMELTKKVPGVISVHSVQTV